MDRTVTIVMVRVVYMLKIESPRNYSGVALISANGEINMGKHTHRHKNVNQGFINFEDAITYDHLLKAYRHCRKGKKFRAATVKFHIDYVGKFVTFIRAS